MAVEDEIQFERGGHVARVWLNGPHKKNWRDGADPRPAGRDHHRGRRRPRAARTGAAGPGNTFCSGFDLDSLKAEFVGRSNAIDVAVKSAKVCDRLYSMKTPSIAVLEGHVTAGGFELMISCDFAIAADDALIGDFHIRRALFGGAGPIYRVPRMIGVRKTKELMLTGKLLTGVEAAEFGLDLLLGAGRTSWTRRSRSSPTSSSTRARSPCGSPR